MTTLTAAVNNSNMSSDGYAAAVAAVTRLGTELPSVRSAFQDIQSNASVEDFSSTVDVIDAVELAR